MAKKTPSWAKVAVGAAALAVVLSAFAMTATAGSQTTLRMVAITEHKDGVEALVKLYKQKNPNVKLTVTVAPVDTYITVIRAQLNSRNAPDLLMSYPGNGNAASVVQLAKSGITLDLSGESWVKQIPKAFRPISQYQGKTYTRPISTGMIGTLYNRAVFKDVGITSLPRTWDELLATCDKLKAAGKIPFALGMATPWNTQLITYALVASTVVARDPGFPQKQIAGKTTFSQSGWRDAFNKYMQMRDRGCFDAGAAGTTYEQSLTQIANGDAGMLVQVFDIIPAIEAANPDVDLGAFPLPGVNTPTKVWAPVGAGPSFAVARKSDDSDEAKKFVAFTATRQAVTAYTKATSTIPILTPIPRVLPASFAPMQTAFNQNRITFYMDQLWPNSQVQPTHFAVVQQLFTKQIDVDEALKQMDTAYKRRR